MKYINQLTDIPSLSLPIEVTEALTGHLLEGFDTIQEANAFWIEYGTHLTLIEPSDTDIEIDKADKEDGYWINFIINNPEYVLLLGTTEPYLLALAIVDTAGAGAYCLIPASHQSHHKKVLKGHIDNHTNTHN